MDADSQVDLAEVCLLTPQDEEVPEARSGHRIITTNGALYSIGGYNPNFWEVENTQDSIYPLFKELWKFCFATRKWTLLRTEGAMPIELASHAALIIGNKLFVHGGTGTPFGGASSNSLYVCDLDSLEWRHIDTSGDIPSKLYGHSITLVNSRELYMFGGTTGYQYSNELHRLDLKTAIWHKLESNPRKLGVPQRRPEGRYRHEIVSDQTYLYVLGGGRSYNTYNFKKLDAFNLSAECWEVLPCQPSEQHGYPGGRRCHSAVKYKEGVYVCGGYDGTVVFNDLWRLDLPTLRWSKVADLAEGVYFHSADVTKEGCMYIFGGVNYIDDSRNADVFRVWLDVPSLLEQCWRRTCRLLGPRIELLGHGQLSALGIPAALIKRL